MRLSTLALLTNGGERFGEAEKLLVLDDGVGKKRGELSAVDQVAELHGRDGVMQRVALVKEASLLAIKRR